MGKSLGQVAYEAYGEARNWKRAIGDQMCSWDELLEEKIGEDVQKAWELAAASVIASTRGGGGVE